MNQIHKTFQNEIVSKKTSLVLARQQNALKYYIMQETVLL